MTFLIEDIDKYLLQQQNICPLTKTSVLDQICGKNIGSLLTSELLPKYFTNPHSTLFHTTLTPKSLIFRYSIPNFYRNLSSIASVHLNIEAFTLKIDLKILNFQNNYAGVEVKEKKKIIFKCLNKKINNRQFTIKIGPVKGEITITSPYFYFSHQLITNKLAKSIQKQLRDIKNHLKSNFQLFDSIFQICEEKGFYLKQSQNNKQEFEFFLKNYHYRKLMNLELCLASQAKAKEQYLNSRWMKEKESMDNIKNGFEQIEAEVHPLSLYTYSLLNEYSDNEIFYNDLRIVGDQRHNIKQRIQLPSLPKERTSEENFYVLNYVLINNRCSFNKGKKINNGGFTEIYLTQLMYWYIGSYGVGTSSDISSITSKPPLKKYVIVKHQNKETIKVGQRSRINHEKFILKQIKNGISLFLCKYYIADKNPQLKDDLLSDYIDYPNLHDYCKRYGQTMSLHTKIYFSILIAQSLRYLKQYEIVHLDLKPSNIMTTRRLSIKIIDFGQSYHPDLGKHVHVPGFSMPYSAPQNYSRQRQFTFKNDVFSLGVMMFELFFSRPPFFFFSQSLRQKVYKSGNFYDYFFFCLEQSKLVGDSLVFPLIQTIISKCLQPDPRSRPELQWIVFILRQCLNYIY